MQAGIIYIDRNKVLEDVKMTNDMKFRAVVQLHNNGIDQNDLKRLVMFFDEIYFIQPTVFTLTDAFIQKKKLFEGEGLPLQSHDFDFLRDTQTGMIRTNIALPPQLNETLYLFQENGIAKDVSQKLEPFDGDFIRVRDYLASYDLHDKIFNELSDTLPQHYDSARVSLSQMSIRRSNQSDTPLMPLFIVLTNPPNSIMDSHEISATLYASQANSSFPVFLHPRLKKIMEYRYLQYKKGLKVLENYSHSMISPTDFKASFGEVTFSIADSLFSSELIAKKTPEEIVKYRNAMNDARQHFISENLMEAASIVQDNPWNSQTKEEIEKYIMGKLKPDILRYNEVSQDTWVKLFGNIVGHVAQVASSAAIGGSAGGLVGNLIPNTSTWHLLLIGALAGAAKEAPNLVKSITEKVLEDRKERRSSIAYIAKFR